MLPIVVVVVVSNSNQAFLSLARLASVVYRHPVSVTVHNARRSLHGTAQQKEVRRRYNAEKELKMNSFRTGSGKNRTTMNREQPAR